MGKIYFAKTKDTQRLYVGARGNTGFSRIGDIKSSISYANRRHGGKSTDDYNFYCVYTESMIIKEVK